MSIGISILSILVWHFNRNLRFTNFEKLIEKSKHFSDNAAHKFLPWIIQEVGTPIHHLNYRRLANHHSCCKKYLSIPVALTELVHHNLDIQFHLPRTELDGNTLFIKIVKLYDLFK